MPNLDMSVLIENQTKIKFMEIQNPKLDIESLSLLKNKIEMNEAKVQDYENLDYFLSSIGNPNYFLNRLKEFNIYSYEEFILERKKPFDKRNRVVDGVLFGTALGSISVLERYVSNKLK